MARVFALAFTAALNPTLLAATTLMLSLERPKRLLAGYLGGALLTSVTSGLVLVFALSGATARSTVQHTASPAVDFLIGGLILIAVVVVATGRDRRRQEWSARRRERAKSKAPPRWRRTLSRGSARDAFVIGMLLSFPGASYVAAMTVLSKQDAGTTETVLVVLAFNLIQMSILELPLLGYVFWPEQTADRVERFGRWLRRRGGRMVLAFATFIGTALILRGIASL